MSNIKNWFSNMTRLNKPYEFEGITYLTSENFYQAMKVESQELRSEIASMNCFESKTCFRKKPDRYVIRESWDTKEKLRVMEHILRVKFAPGTTWYEQLIATGDEQIVEYNDWGDFFWGWDLKVGKGSNHLGKLLMKLRDEYTRIELDDFMME